jgi:quinol monooxygenase YgiN
VLHTGPRKAVPFIAPYGIATQSRAILGMNGMSSHVFVVSEWLPKENCDEELWDFFKELMALTKKNEPGCIRAHATRQIPHPAAAGKSKYKITLLQEYVDIKAFDAHCHADYVKSAFKKCVEDDATSLVQEWSVRLLNED